MLNEQKQSVAVWVGNFAKKSEFNKYLKETYGEDDDETPISLFAADMKSVFYDHDFVFGEWSRGKPKSIAKLLEGWNYAASFADKAVKAANKKGIEFGNTVILAYDHKLSPAKWPDKAPVQFLGNFVYADDPPAAAQPAKQVKGHKAAVCKLAYAPDGKLLVSGAVDGSLIAWDAATGQAVSAPAAAFNKTLRDIYYIGFSADGSRCVGGTIAASCVWDPFPTAADCGKELKDIAARQVSADGRFAFDTYGRALDLNSGKPAKHLDGKLDAADVAVMPDGRVASVNDDGDLQIWNAETGKCLVSLPGDADDSADEIAVSPQGKFAATFGSRTLVIWDLAKKKRSKVITSQDTFIEVRFPDEKTLLAMKRDTLELYSLPGGKLKATLTPMKLPKDMTHWRLHVSGNGAVALVQITGREYLDLWDLKAGKFVCRFPDEKAKQRPATDAVAISPDGKQIVLGRRDGKLTFLQLSGNQLTATK